MKIIVALLVLTVLALAWQGSAQRASSEEQRRRLDALTARLDAKPHTTSIELQEKCAKRAHDQFQQDGWEKQPASTYQNHYSETLGKCFVLVVNTSLQAPFSTSKLLLDAFEGKLIANYMWLPKEHKKYWEVAPVQCEVTQASGVTKYCTSSDEFEELVKAYLE